MGGRPGGCLCGAVRYEFEGEPLAFYACHCTDCQRQTGTAFGLSMIVAQEALRLTKGEAARFHVKLPDGREKRGRYCGTCATRLWGEPVKLPQVRVLRPGTLDAPMAYAPHGDIWTDSALPWAGRTAGPQFPRQPESPLALVEAWKQRG